MSTSCFSPPKVIVSVFVPLVRVAVEKGQLRASYAPEVVCVRAVSPMVPVAFSPEFVR